MQRIIGTHQLDLVEGDITEQKVDAIVNAANAGLAGGGGVDGAIHRRGGPTIMEESDRRYPEGCPTGSAVITDAGELPCLKVIHAVGPVWGGGTRDEESQLAAAYLACLELAREHELRSIAFPALSAGAYGYPLPEAARVAVSTVHAYLVERQDPPMTVRFVLFGREAFDAFKKALSGIE